MGSKRFESQRQKDGNGSKYPHLQGAQEHLQCVAIDNLRPIVIFLAISTSYLGALMNKDHVKGKADSLKGAAKNIAGDITGNSSHKAEGTVDKIKGAVKQTVADAKDKIGTRHGIGVRRGTA